MFAAFLNFFFVCENSLFKYNAACLTWYQDPKLIQMSCSPSWKIGVREQNFRISLMV